MVRDSHSGKFRINMCVGDYADKCSLRIVEVGDGRFEQVKLQLVLFDEFGFVTAKHDFPLES